MALFQALRSVSSSIPQTFNPALATSFPKSTSRYISATTNKSKLVPDSRADEREYTEIQRDFLDPAEFYEALKQRDLDFFCGVPDSLLKDFCAYVSVNAPKEKHIMTANEGAAIGVASGYHLATGKPAVVYLQNSGLGNIVNPLLSLAAPEVYSIPMCLLIGWRGEPGKKDEPQHLVQGQATPGLLASLNIPFQILPDFQEGAEKMLDNTMAYMKNNCGPYAVLVRRQTFLPFKLPKTPATFEHNRETALQLIVDSLNARDCVVGTTGMLSRELFEYRVAKKQGHARDFLTVGSMGHASSIALGIAVARPNQSVYCLDGDGAVLMHMGSLATVSMQGVENYKHIVINNGAHDSVGGQETGTLTDSFNLIDIATGCGYRWAKSASTTDEIKSALEELKTVKGPALLEVRVNKGHRKDLGRPTRSPLQNKQDFMQFLKQQS
eukprot:comp17113_c0_seq1/m.15893 comp17113_c0_seq1/g.15893  ORF comp17113_c0_seq1/g.15893 comp17113_c0_seq1/m.15893 type:complete len:439 (-) comp17113_c0_seq1:90-1406(-)